MKNILVLVLVLSINSSYAVNTTAVTVDSDYAVPTTGLNPASHEPLPGSDWEVAQSTIFAGNCLEFNGGAEDIEVKYYDTIGGTVATKTVVSAVRTDYLYNDGDSYEILNSFLERHPVTLSIPEDCSTASHPNDPTDILGAMGQWNDVGLDQNVAYGVDSILCGVGNACGKDGVLVVQNIINEDQIFSNITPTQGVDGTAPGKADVFIYDVNTLNTSNSIGYGGAGGLADLDNLDSTRYCVKLKDYSTEGAASPYALNPTLDIYVYQFYPIKQAPSQPQGNTPSSASSKVQVFKKVDSNMRYYLRYNSIDNPYLP